MSDNPSNPFESFGALLRGPQSGLQKVAARAKRFKAFQQALLERLPEHLREHAVLVQLDEKRWIVRTESATWATRLRYVLHGMRASFGEQVGITLPEPQIRVVVETPPPELLTKPRPQLTERSVRALRDAAAKINDDELSPVLLRLAHRIQATVIETAPPPIHTLH